MFSFCRIAMRSFLNYASISPIWIILRESNVHGVVARAEQRIANVGVVFLIELTGIRLFALEASAAR